MPTPSVCARHSSYLHVLNADTSHRNDNRLAVADHMLDDRLNLILSFETNCCPVRQTRVRLAYTRTAFRLHVRPMSHRAFAWSLEQTPRGGNHKTQSVSSLALDLLRFPFCEMFCASVSYASGHSLHVRFTLNFCWLTGLEPEQIIRCILKQCTASLSKDGAKVLLIFGTGWESSPNFVPI